MCFYKNENAENGVVFLISVSSFSPTSGCYMLYPNLLDKVSFLKILE